MEWLTETCPTENHTTDISKIRYMNSIDEIFAFPTWEERIAFIKASRRTPLPATKENMDAWFTKRHKVYDHNIRKDMKTLVKEEYTDRKGVVHLLRSRKSQWHVSACLLSRTQ